MRLKIGVAILAVFATFLCSASAAAAQPAEEKRGLSASDFFIYPMQFFRKYISGADGERCSMHPSCSAYGLESIKKNGPAMGYLMTCDRLLRCGGDEKKTSPSVDIEGESKTYDPVFNNDFWWKQPSDRGK